MFLALGALPEAVECAERGTLKLARSENYYTLIMREAKITTKITTCEAKITIRFTTREEKVTTKITALLMWQQ